MAIESTNLSIPVIDLAPIRSGTAEKALETGKKVFSAFRDVGFAYIKNHGLAQELQDQAFEWSAKFFALPQSAKDQAPHPPYGWWHRGYSGVGREKVVQMVFDEATISQLRQTPDFKESFELGREDDERTPNIWLPEHILPGFRQFMTNFYEQCYLVELAVLRAIALGMGLPEAFFHAYHTKKDNQLRLLHYPPVEAELLQTNRVERIAAHTDFGTMTLLLQDEVGGLEVEIVDRKDDKVNGDQKVEGVSQSQSKPKTENKFIPAPYIPGTIVVNIGDFLQRWSNDTLKSTLHRVRAPPLVQVQVQNQEGKGEESDNGNGNGNGNSNGITRARYSIPYFVTADREKTIDCIPGCYDESRPKKYEPINAREYIEMRLNATY